jgi:hypothetical protein
MEDRPRVLAETIGQLLVGVGLLEGEPQDPESQWMGQRPHLRRGRIALGRIDPLTD